MKCEKCGKSDEGCECDKPFEPPNDAWVFLIVLLLSPFVYLWDLIKEWGKKR
jgi:hypothetical protein